MAKPFRRLAVLPGLALAVALVGGLITFVGVTPAGATAEATTTSLNTLTSPIYYGSETSETFTGTVTGQSGDGYPEGTVAVYYGSGPPTELCSGALTGGSGDTASYSCSLTAIQLPAATYSNVDAVFTPGTPTGSEDPTYTYGTSTSAAQSFTVSTPAPETTTTSLNTVTSPITYGSEISETFTGTVTGVSGDGYPQGFATVYYGSGPTSLCSSVLTESSSYSSSYSCSLTASQLPATTYTSVDAVFLPNSSSSSSPGYAYTTSTSTPAQSFIVAAATSTPTVTTSAATGTTSTTATLNGTVNANGLAITNCYFEYGTSVTYPTLTAACSPSYATISGTSVLTGVSAAIGSLSASTTYYFQLEVTYSSTNYGGGELSFLASTTGTTTAAATNVTATSATLNGTVYPEGYATTYYFAYGLSSSSLTAITTSNTAGASYSSVAAAATVTGLSPNTTYYFELVAYNSYYGTSFGGVLSFFTASGAPTVSTTAATSVTATGATLNGTVNPNGSTTNYYFEYGTTTGYGADTTATSAGSGTAAIAVSAVLTGLSRSTTYHFQIVATNTGGTTYGGALSFTTSRGVGTTRVTVAPSSPPSVVAGASVAYEASVAKKSGSGTLTGSVSFAVNGHTLAACTKEALKERAAKCTITFSSPGSFRVRATYGDDPYFRSSSAFVTQVVTEAVPPVVTVVPNEIDTVHPAGTVKFGSVIELRIHLYDGYGTVAGSVTVQFAGKVLCSATLANGVANCTLNSSSLGHGKHTLVVVYGGQGSYLSYGQAVVIAVT